MPANCIFLPTAAPAPRTRHVRKYACVLVCGLSLALSMAKGSRPAWAEELSVDEMACALDPQCKTQFVDRRLRGITATPSVRTPGSFDRTINFAFNSAELTAEARKELDAVAESLKLPNIKNLDIVIAGHTDIAGGAEYNQGLSERRAEAARQYLITQHGIGGNRLIAKGYGETKLLLPSEPTNELNRRVEFQNPNYVASSAPASARPLAPNAGGTPTNAPGGGGGL
jgi:outer membrane protein OmpA-like peptidoglycan-associated protein